MKKRLALLFVALTSLVLLAGCGGTLDTLLQGSGSNIDSWVGTNSSDKTAGTGTGTGTTSTGGAESVELYFADSTGKYLVKEERSIPTTLSMARETITQWLMGPAVKNGSSQAAVSPTTTLKDVNLKDGVLTVDLSKDFTKTYNNVSPQVSVYGLVDTMTQFTTIKEVRLRVEGENLNTLGDLDLTHLIYNESLVKSDPAQASNSNPDSDSNSDSSSNSDTGSGSDTNSNSGSGSGSSSDGSSSNSSGSGSGSNSPSALNLFK